MRLSELVEWYIGMQADLRPASKKALRAATKAMIGHFKDVDVESVEHQHVIDWRTERVGRDLERKSWNTYSNNMKTLYQLAMDEEIIQLRRNPFRKTAVKLISKPKKTLSRIVIEQARLYLEQLEREEKLTHKRAKATPAWFWRCVYETYWSTGMRLSALLHIRPMDVDLYNKKITVRGETEKTYRQYQVPITTSLEPFIRRLCEAARVSGIGHQDQLFNVNRFSEHYEKEVMDPDQVEAFYKKLTAAVGTPITPHRFRHTLATDLMKEKDRNLNVVQTLLNHSSITTTLGYVETDFEIMREVMTERESQGRVSRMVARVDDGSSRQALDRVRPQLIEAPSTHPDSPETADTPPQAIGQSDRIRPAVAAKEPANSRVATSRPERHAAQPQMVLTSHENAVAERPDLESMHELMSALLHHLTQGTTIPIPALAGVPDQDHRSTTTTFKPSLPQVRAQVGQGMRGS